MIKNRIVKRTAVALMAALLGAAAFFAALPVLSPAEAYEDSAEGRMLSFLDSNVDGMNYVYDADVTRSGTKTLFDFAGNTYTLIECSPAGYMIMCDDAAAMVEYSANSPSPYAGYTSGLYYGGPSYFYVLEDGVFKHTITGETLDYSPIHTYSSEETSDPVAEACDEMYQDMMLNKNQAALNFINNGISTYGFTDGIYGDYFVVITKRWFFQSKNNEIAMGYYPGGYCGFIAAGMILGFCDTFWLDCVPDSYMFGADTNRHFVGSALTEELIAIANANGWNASEGSNSSKIKKVVEKYMSNHGISGTTSKSSTMFFTASTIKNLISDETPCILFGNLGAGTMPDSDETITVGNHACVIYGYKQGGYNGSGYAFLANYGLPGYAASTVNYMSSSFMSSLYRLVV